MSRWYATNPQHVLLPGMAACASVDSIRFEQTKPSLGRVAAMR